MSYLFNFNVRETFFKKLRNTNDWGKIDYITKCLYSKTKTKTNTEIGK